MPTTLTGLLLFIVLLLPGFAYLVGKERAGTERRTSPFRETIAVIAASIAAELVVLLVALPIWTRQINFVRLARDPGQYWRCSPGTLAAWAAGLLLGATALAYVTTWPTLRRRLLPRVLPKRLREHVTYPHPSSVSAWWLLFEHYEPERAKHVGLVLDDGSFVSGTELSFNNDASEGPDRDIILLDPITYRAPGADDVEPYPGSMVSISARRIVIMFVTPVESTETPTPEPSELPVASSQARRNPLRGLLRWRRRRGRGRADGDHN